MTRMQRHTTHVLNFLNILSLFGLLVAFLVSKTSLSLASTQVVTAVACAATHLPHARAASSACEYAFAGEVAQPQATPNAVDVAATAAASPRIARVGAGSHLGTPRDLLDGDGTVRWSAAYTAWGKIHEEYVADTQGPRGPPTTQVRSPFRLLGQYFDEETGLSATRFRMWEAETGRWLSPDPLGVVGGPNLVGFDGSPTVDIDPLGLEKCQRGRMVDKLKAILLQKLPRIREIMPDAKIGFRGSLASGKKGPHKGNAPFDPDDFDIDLFVTSRRARPGGGFQIAPREIRQIAREIEAELRKDPDFAGLRGGRDRPQFRLWNEGTLSNKRARGDIQIFAEE